MGGRWRWKRGKRIDGREEVDIIKIRKKGVTLGRVGKKEKGQGNVY